MGIKASLWTDEAFWKMLLGIFDDKSLSGRNVWREKPSRSFVKMLGFTGKCVKSLNLQSIVAMAIVHLSWECFISCIDCGSSLRHPGKSLVFVTKENISLTKTTFWNIETLENFSELFSIKLKRIIFFRLSFRKTVQWISLWQHQSWNIFFLNIFLELKAKRVALDIDNACMITTKMICVEGCCLLFVTFAFLRRNDRKMF